MVTEQGNSGIPKLEHKRMGEGELCRHAENSGAIISWANDPDEFHHLIEFTPVTLRKFIGDNSRLMGKVFYLIYNGYVVGARDPNRNTNFTGKYMVAVGIAPEDLPSLDARDGFCIVGDDFVSLVNEAFETLQLP